MSNIVETLSAKNTQKKPAISVQSVTRRFGDCLANDHVSLEIFPGEVHAIVGENGAGKTTLMRVLYGEIQPDEGDLFISGAKTQFSSSADAINHGIAMVHQQFLYIGNFTVLDNIILGHEPTRWGIVVDRGQAKDKLFRLSQEFGLSLDLERFSDSLDTWELQKLEILKALYRDARILILDEPTQVLGSRGVEELFGILRGLKASGKSLIFITHKIPEVMAIADRVTVLRRGRVIAAGAIDQFSAESLASHIMGEKSALTPIPLPGGEGDKGVVSILTPTLSLREREERGECEAAGPAILELTHVSTESDKAFPVALKDLSFRVHEGEIVGLYGVEGNGQKELFNVLTGHLKVRTGALIFQGVSLSGQSLESRMKKGLAFVGERATQGFVGDMSFWENVILTRSQDNAFVRGWRLMLDNILFLASRVVSVFGVKIDHIGCPVRSLSGGNQQKALLGRELTKTQAKVFVLKEPTRGMDIQSTNFLHEKIKELTARNASALLISNELTEILKLSRRILVLARGRLAGELTPEEIARNPERLGALIGQ